MQAGEFISKWEANVRPERSACQEHFIDLCSLLGEPTPNSDPTGAIYAFEKGATKAVGGEGWADVWRKERFAWEYKKKGRDLNAAHKQLLLYAGALGNPPLLVVSDIERIVVRTNWTNAVSEHHEILLPAMADPSRLSMLKSVFSDPERLRPGKTREALTGEAAGQFAELARRLRARGQDAMAVAHFVNRLAFCLFASDAGLLPAGLFERLLGAARKNPARFEGYIRRLFGAMAERGGEVDFTPVPWFNGGLFDDAAALPLNGSDVELLQRVAALDWAEVDPSILGTLFERGLDPDKRSQLGAHYTDRDKIERLITPLIRRPLLAEWKAVRADIEAAHAKVLASKPGSRVAANAVRESLRLFQGFLDRLRAFRVLDPACGSGNFLYLSLLALKDLEHQAMVEAETLGLQREFPQVGPEAVLGIEVNPYAAELARVSVWIGHIQWARRHGLPAPSDPVLRKLDTIECRDAVLADDGTQAVWPKANVILGNPPFLGGNRLRGVLGDVHCERLFVAYAGRVPAEADLVCYWFERAREEVAEGRAERAGLVATNSIRGGANRRALDRIADGGRITQAWSDEPWTLDGAAVRVSLVCWSSTNAGGVSLLNGEEVDAIRPDLTAGGADLTTARRLPENLGITFQGSKKVSPFEVSGVVARTWLLQPSNPNGRTNSDVLRPSWIGMDVVRRPRDAWIVDFSGLSQEKAAFYSGPFAHVLTQVKPLRDENRDRQRRERWWLFGRSGADFRAAIAPFRRCIVTPEVSKYRIFAWAPLPVLPDCQLMVTARDDDVTFGILHSRFHQIWSLRLGTALEDRPRYTPSTTFETFPFPDGLTPDRPAAVYADDTRAETIAVAARALVEARDRWLNPPELVEQMSEVVPGFQDRIVPRDQKATAVLRTRTLTNLYNSRGKTEGAWLDNLHRALDAAVAAAYGWPETYLSDEEVLTRLLALNLKRSNRF